MNKDRQDAAQKYRAIVRMADPTREAKRARGSAKAAAFGSSKPVPPAKAAAPRPSKASASAKAAASGGGRPPLGGPTKGQELPSPGRRVADFNTNISVEDYLVGKFFFDRRYVAGSGEGQLVVVPPLVATTSPSAVMARAKDVEDLGDLVGASPEAEVDPVPPSSAGEGSSAAPVPTVAGEGPLPAPASTAEDPPKVAAEPVAEDPMAAVGPSQVA
eukprot:XP_008675992.1 uncharacterized protein LOC103652123 [Zea mays]